MVDIFNHIWFRKEANKNNTSSHVKEPWLKTTTLVWDHKYFIPTKFHQSPSSRSGEEFENVKNLQTDGRVDEKQTARYDNSPLESSAQVS